MSPLISYIFGEDTTSVPGIICGTLWRSFPVLGSFAVHAVRDHLRSCTDLLRWPIRQNLLFHGKTYFFSAKLNFSRQNLIFHGKTYFFTAKRNFSRQNVIFHGKLTFPRRNLLFHGKSYFSTAKCTLHTTSEPAERSAVKMLVSQWNDTITAFIFAANKDKNSAQGPLASTSS